MSERAYRHEGVVVSVGFYDGVHLGHRHLIEAALACARGRGEACVAVTFDRHPASVVRPELAPRLLTAVDQKLELLETSGVDGVHLVHFDQQRAKESADEFVEEVLVRELGASAVVVGVNFRFGFERRGDLAFLREVGPVHGFDAVGVELYRDEARDEIVSSSRIRRLLETGALDEAAALIGRPHEVRGFVTNAATTVTEPVGLVVDAELLLPPEGRYQVGLRIGELELDARATIAGELVEFEAGSAASVPAVHPGARISLAFLGRA